MAVAAPNILLLLMVGGLLLGGLALLVGLVINRKTRPVGLAIAAAGALFLVAATGWLTVQRSVAVQHSHHAQADALHQQAREHHQRLMRGHGGELPTFAGEGYHALPATATDHSTTLRLGSWAALSLLIVVTGVAYAAMKILNHSRGLPRAAVLGGAGVAALLALMLVVRTASVRSPPQVAASSVAHDGQALSAAEAWDELTRPRIQLEPQTNEIALRGPRLTVYVSEEDTNEQLADRIRVQQNNLRAGEELTVDIHGATFTARGRTSRDALLRSITEARSQLAEKSKAEPAEGDPPPQKIVVNGQELSFDAGTPLTEVVEKIQEVQQQDPESLTEVEVSDQVIKVEPGESLQGVEDALQTSNQKPRPAWVDQPAKRIGEVYRQVITTDPFTTADECYADFMVRLRDATNKYGQTQLGYHRNAVAVSGLSPGELASAVGVDEFLETYQSSAGPMKRLHVRVEFDQDFRDQLERAFTLRERQGVLENLTVVGSLVLLLIGGVLGLLKLDEATKGYYTKRLFIGVPAAIIGLFLFVVALKVMGADI